LSFSYDSRPVFKGLSLSFGGCWTALIGANGTGKSTLIRLISGLLVPLAGSIAASGPVAVCPQEQETPPDCFFDPGIVNEGAFFALLSRLGIGDDWVDRWGTLSEGEKKRCVIADTLIRKPAVLILDEPVNHLDETATSLLSDTLSSFKGTGIVVSHNMTFLDSLAESTVLLTAGHPDTGSRAFFFAASPENALLEFEKDQEARRDTKRRLDASVKKEQRAKKDAVAEAEQDKNSRMTKKNLAAHDSDTRAKINLARLSGRDRTGGKKVRTLAAVIAQKEAEREMVDVAAPRKTGAALRGRRSSRPVLFFAAPGEITVADGAYTLTHPELEITSNSHIVITGENGSGKTSLLKYIAARLNARLTGKDACWYLPQELESAERQNALRNLNALPEKEKGAALSLIYRLGSEPAALLLNSGVSPGEARKILFASAMLRGVSCILLDEPSNHMDTVAANSLSSAIQEFEGAAVLVTHDRVFAEKTGNVFWKIERHGNEGRVVI
jgi:ATPase subunit of ABC transporter with duplicated ATPase domains